MTIQAKTALLFTILTAAIIGFLSMGIYFFERSYVSNDFLKRLEFRTVLAHRLHFEKNRTSVEVYNALREQYLETLPHQTGYLFQVTDTGYSLIDTADPQVPKTYLDEVVSRGSNTSYYRKGNVYYAGQLYRDRTGDFIFLTSAVNLYGIELLQNLRRVLVFTFLVGILLVLAIARFFSRQVFQPVRNIISRVQNISAQNLHTRLETKLGKDEITELANTFNNMLDRLQTAFETQNNFVSNASHELRTPLTAISGEAELALSRDRTTEEYQKSLLLISREAEKLQQLTKSLLTLAQSGFDGKKQNWEEVRIDELLFAIKESLDQVDPGNQVRLNFSTLPEDADALSTFGNEQLLRLAFSNVIRNACKYSSGKPVELKLLASAEEISLSVSDTGIGIPAEDLPHIFDPFFRASNAEGKYDGYGVGLPLARAIMRLHDGNIQVVSEEGKGTTVVLQLLPLVRQNSRLRN